MTSPTPQRRETFVIIQSDDEDETSGSTSIPNFIGGIYLTLESANRAALDSATERCNCLTTILPLSSFSNSISDASGESTPLSAQEAAHISLPTAVEARPHLVQRTQSADGRWTCKYMARGTSSASSFPFPSSSSASEPGSKDNDISSFADMRNGQGEEDKAVKLEVRKIEVRKLGTMMAWSFSDVRA